ncbi:putative saccharopine dehydrogenase [Clostridia bacterium]|nr:putative saccharopine dehydrogenase [Clostridia bacterium]
MKLLIIGAGGVGTSVAQIMKRAGAEGEWAERVVLADHDFARAEGVCAQLAQPRFVAETVDAGDAESITGLIRKHGITQVLNVVAPAFNEVIFDTCYENGVGYMDCAMTLSKRDADDPFHKVNVKLGDYQFARHEQWAAKGILALVGSGVEPGMSDVFAKYAEKHLFDEIDEVNVRDGDNYTGGGDFGFSVWTTIEECLKPPIIWEKDKGWFTTERFSEPEIFEFPGGIGDVEVVNVEHEEVVLVPRGIDCNRVTFKYGVPAEFRRLLLDLESVDMAEAQETVTIGNVEITPRDFLVKILPNPVEHAGDIQGKGCAGAWVTGMKDGLYRSVYLYQLADNQACVQKYGTNSVVAQTAVIPVIMLELIAKGIWKAVGVHGPESFDPDPAVARLAKYEFPAGMHEMDSPYAEMIEAEKLLEPLRLGPGIPDFPTFAAVI